MPLSKCVRYFSSIVQGCPQTVQLCPLAVQCSPKVCANSTVQLNCLVFSSGINNLTTAFQRFQLRVQCCPTHRSSLTRCVHHLSSIVQMCPLLDHCCSRSIVTVQRFQKLYSNYLMVVQWLTTSCSIVQWCTLTAQRSRKVYSNCPIVVQWVNYLSSMSQRCTLTVLRFRKVYSNCAIVVHESTICSLLYKDVQ